MRTQGQGFLSMLLVCAVGCALEPVPDESTIASTEQEIVGGQAGAAGQFPTTVGILINGGNNGLCTGTLIDPNWVLTAAHCIHPSVLGLGNQTQVTNLTTVVFDKSFVFGGGGNTIGAAATIPHPGFSLQALGDNDIGLIKLQQPVTDRAPTPINRKAADAPVGISVQMVGYGVSQVGNPQSAGNLFFLQSKTSVSCAFAGESDALLLCFRQNDGTGKCEGDSGGPSFATINGFNKVVGVTSFGDQNCTQFGADTRVDAELDFLFQHAPELQCQADGECLSGICGANGLPGDPDCPTCGGDGDCGDGEVCFHGFCVGGPQNPGGLGSDCSATACTTGTCASGPDGMRCTDVCDPAANDCPTDFDCLPAGATGACWPSDDAINPPDDPGPCGCRVGGRERPTWPAAIFLGAFLAVVVFRRRR